MLTRMRVTTVLVKPWQCFNFYEETRDLTDNGRDADADAGATAQAACRDSADVNEDEDAKAEGDKYDERARKGSMTLQKLMLSAAW